MIVGGLAIGLFLWKQRGEPGAVAATATPPVTSPTGSAFQKPDWIISEAPSTSLCQEVASRLVCVGVSSYRRTKDDAVTDANDAALEELVNSVGLKISDPLFRDSVLSDYSAARTKALAALQAADTDRTSTAYTMADDAVRKARHRVVEILQGSGGPAVPARRSDWYWEEYAVEKGAGTEYLVYVRYDVPSDAVKSLVDRYSATTAVSGSAAMTAFPGLAWQYQDFTGGAMITKVASPLSGAGIAAQQIVMAAGDQRVLDAGGFARRLEDWKRATGDLALTVKTGNAPAQVVQLHR
jgi:hypothetical protein